MKKHLTILAVQICLAAIIYFAVGNFIPECFNYTCPFNGGEYQTNYAVFAAAICLFTVFETIILYMIFDMAERETLKAYKKEREKNCISEAEKDSKIQALENKIKTLETALDSVIKKNNQ